MKNKNNVYIRIKLVVKYGNKLKIDVLKNNNQEVNRTLFIGIVPNFPLLFGIVQIFFSTQQCEWRVARRIDDIVITVFIRV